MTTNKPTELISGKLYRAKPNDDPGRRLCFFVKKHYGSSYDYEPFYIEEKDFVLMYLGYDFNGLLASMIFLYKGIKIYWFSSMSALHYHVDIK